jgi:hypothetical protein
MGVCSRAAGSVSKEKKMPVEMVAIETHDAQIENRVEKVASGASRKA